MSDSTKQERIEELLRKSLLGEELVNTQFHLFSAKSSLSRRVVKPRVLCANNVLLAKSSKYFLDLLSSDVNPSDPSLIDLMDDTDVPDGARIDDYGYGSDSDLDDCNDPAEDQSPTLYKTGSGAQSKNDDESSDDESVSSDMFVMSPEQPTMHEPFPIGNKGAGSVASSVTAVQEGRGKTRLANHTAMRLRSLGSRHVLVKDTAFQTWYTLLNYLYTDKFSFLPLGSATPAGQPRESSTSALDEPKCSAKSMYRLACKVGMNDLRDEAFSYIRSNLTEHNILTELSCSLVSNHPELLEMELDVLYTHIATAPVVANFSALAQRIANKELPHGADVIMGIHSRLLNDPLPLRRAPPPPPVSYSEGKNMELEDGESESDDEDEDDDKPRPPHIERPTFPAAPRAQPPSIKLGPAPVSGFPVSAPKVASTGPPFPSNLLKAPKANGVPRANAGPNDVRGAISVSSLFGSS